VGRDNTPTLWKSNPNLALPPAHRTFRRISFKFKRNAAEISAEAHDIQPDYSARKVGGGAILAKGLQLFVPVEIFGHSEAHDFRRCPEHLDQRVDVV